MTLDDVIARAVDPHTEPTVLLNLSCHGEERVRRAVATNPGAPPEALYALLDEFPDEILSHPMMSEEQLSESDWSEAAQLYREQWVADGRLPAWWLDRFVDSPDPSVRERLARNPSVSPSALEKLQWDHAPEVRAGVASAHGLLATWLERLAQDRETRVRHAVARNATCPVLLIERLARDPHRDVRAGVAANPSTPAAVLECLACDADSGIRCDVARHRSTPPAVLEALARDCAYGVALMVAWNAVAPVAVLAWLAEHGPDADVRQAAAERLPTDWAGSP